jgi:hypothetical protein
VISRADSDAVKAVDAADAVGRRAPLLRLMLALVRPGSTVLDLGADVGPFALAAAAAGCRVLAVEESPRNLALLRASAAVNDFGDRLRIVRAAAGPLSRDRIETLLADGLGVRKLDFIKMAVAGAEAGALEGMKRLLQREDAPPILYQSDYRALHAQDQTPRRLRATFRELGYAHHHLIQPGRLVPAGHDYFQAEVNGAYLATKSRPAIRGWPIAAPLTPDEQTRLLASECLAPTLSSHRPLLARALSEAPPELLAYAPLCELLQWLWGNDSSTELPRAVLRRLRRPAQRLRRGVRGVGRWFSRLRRLFASPSLDRAG